MPKLLGVLLCVFSMNLLGQANTQDSMPGMNMPVAGDLKESHSNPPITGDASAMHAMENHHLGMGAHMKMTELRSVKPGDQERADKVVEAARAVAQKYQDYRVALAEGYRIFLPNVPQKQYHFTNYGNAWQARYRFDPARPTSLLYEKQGNDYKLIGVMYTARKDATEEELDARIPLSIAQWHAHVNLCMPPRDQRADALPPNAKFGLAGSIATKQACDAAGGRFLPQVFGWMVHLYPFEKNPADIWSVERQHAPMD